METNSSTHVYIADYSEKVSTFPVTTLKETKVQDRTSTDSVTNEYQRDGGEFINLFVNIVLSV